MQTKSTRETIIIPFAAIFPELKPCVQKKKKNVETELFGTVKIINLGEFPTDFGIYCNETTGERDDVS